MYLFTSLSTTIFTFCEKQGTNSVSGGSLIPTGPNCAKRHFEALQIFCALFIHSLCWVSRLVHCLSLSIELAAVDYRLLVLCHNLEYTVSLPTSHQKETLEHTFFRLCWLSCRFLPQCAVAAESITL